MQEIINILASFGLTYAWFNTELPFFIGKNFFDGTDALNFDTLTDKIEEKNALLGHLLSCDFCFCFWVGVIIFGITGFGIASILFALSSAYLYTKVKKL